jgi:hypothetical protein
MSRNVIHAGFLWFLYYYPVFRTKRWQRRWFVLYDDGELTYSVDDHPETIPQVFILVFLYKIFEKKRQEESLRICI